MKKLITTIFILACFNSTYSQDTIQVPLEQSSIQTAIDAANNGDLVLVAEGIYYENINFKGKAITVASYFIINGDTSHISKTIIDGSQNTNPDNPNNQVVLFGASENTNTKLTGFTITGGGTGIFIYYSNPTIEYLIIKNNISKGGWQTGSGIMCNFSSGVEFDHLQIYNNSSTDRGGGISCTNARITVKNSIISNNHSYEGGGIWGDYYVELINTIIKENSATYGGGIWCAVEMKFDSVNRSSIYLNSAAIGKDLYQPNESLHINHINVVVDTFTVISPTEDLASPINKFNFNILNEKIDLIDADLFVSQNGDNENDGMSSSNPLKTITRAISKIASNPTNPRTVHILDGYYSIYTNGESFPIGVKPYITLSGQSRNSVVLDAGGLNSVIICDNDILVSIRNLTIKGAGYYEYSSGIKCSNTILNIENVTIKENKGGYSSGIYCNGNSKVYVKNSDIIDNERSGIYCNYGPAPSLLSLNNVTISANKNDGGIYIEGLENLEMDSCSIYGNEGGGLRFYGGKAEINHTTIGSNKGTGISSYGEVKIYNSKICNNSAGGGISTGGKITLSNVTIAHNKSTGYGGGISINSWGSLFFASRCNIYSNSAIKANDLYSDAAEIINVIVDTFTVIKPTEYFCSPLEKFSFDILNSKIEQVNADLFVNPSGDNLNSGLSINEPLENIAFALSKIYVDSLNPRSIYLSEGIYSPSSNNENYPIVPISNIKLIGTSMENTILNIEGHSEPTFPMGILISNHNNIQLKNFTLTGAYPTSDLGSINCVGSHSLVFNNLVLTDNIGVGIKFYNSTASIKNITFKNNLVLDGSGWGYYFSGSGGGLNSNSSILVLEDVNFINNKASMGGAIYCANSTLQLDGGIIEKNGSKAGSGGGIYLCENSNITMKNLTIRENYAKSGGGIFYGWGNSKITFDATERCNIYLNHAALGSDFGCPTSEDYNMSYPINVVLDTFTVLTPTNYNCNPLSNFTFNILNGKLAQINADLYVSPTGNNLNSGLNEWEPLGSISTALMKIIASNTNPHTIYLANGVYSPSTTNDGFPINLPDYVSLKGASQIATILNADQQGSVLHFDGQKGNTVDNLTLMGGYDRDGGGIYCSNSSPGLFNLTIHSNIAHGTSNWEGWSSAGYGGGIYCVNNSNSNINNILFAENEAIEGVLAINNSSPVVTKVKISNNNYGCGIYCSNSSSKFRDIILENNNKNSYWTVYGGIRSIYSNVLFTDLVIMGHNVIEDGGLLYSFGSDNVFVNSTVAGNTISEEFSSILLDGSNMTIVNSILWNKINGDIKFSEGHNNLNIAYSNIQGGQNAIISNSMSAVNWLDGNINLNPLFVDTANHNYHLSSKSPCLGAGIDSIQIEGIWYYAPKKDLAGNPRPDPIGSKPDMGAYESQLFTEVSESENELPLIFALYQNFPNSFNPTTTIKYSIPKESKVSLIVFNLLAEKVATLVDEKKPTGNYSIEFNASSLPSGVYFYRIQAGNFIDTKKMILLR